MFEALWSQVEVVGVELRVCGCWCGEDFGVVQACKPASQPAFSATQPATQPGSLNSGPTHHRQHHHFPLHLHLFTLLTTGNRELNIATFCLSPAVPRTTLAWACSSNQPVERQDRSRRFEPLVRGGNPKLPRLYQLSSRNSEMLSFVWYL